MQATTSPIKTAQSEAGLPPTASSMQDKKLVTIRALENAVRQIPECVTVAGGQALPGAIECFHPELIFDDKSLLPKTSDYDFVAPRRQPDNSSTP